MTIVPSSYRFTSADKGSIEALGYTISVIDGMADFTHFMQSVYPDFDLLKLLQVVQRVMIPATTLPVERMISFNSVSAELVISVRNHYTGEADAVVFKRTFRKPATGIVVHHDYFVLPATHRQLGLAKPVFQESLQQYVSMGVSKIFVHAALSGGGYSWARHGFTITDRSDVDRILAEARKKLFPAQVAAVERIYDYYYNNPDPAYSHAAFPVSLWAGLPFMKDVLQGSNWHGQLDLQNTEQITNFTKYVFRS